MNQSKKQKGGKQGTREARASENLGKTKAGQSSVSGQDSGVYIYIYIYIYIAAGEYGWIVAKGLCQVQI